MMLTIILFSFAEADQHENVRRAAVCKRRRFNGVVRYMSPVYDTTSFRDNHLFLTRLLGRNSHVVLIS